MAVGGKACNKFVLFSLFCRRPKRRDFPGRRRRYDPIRTEIGLGGWATKPIEGGQKVGRFHGVVNQNLTAKFSLSSLPEVVNSITAAAIFLPI